MTHAGLELGHKMAEIAGLNAGEEWMLLALGAFREFAKSKYLFTTEQVRAAYPDLPSPPDKRAWGQVARMAKSEGFVTSSGWTRAESPTVHGMVVTLWQSKIYYKE